MNRHRRAVCSLVALGTTFAAGPVRAAMQMPTDDPAASAIWLKVRASLFAGREIAAAPPGLLTLDVPARAIDAAVVPLAIRARSAEPGRWVQRLYLVIDANPSPVSAIFTFGATAGAADVETRVRIDDYSFVRAIAELDDGRLFGVTRFVKASGGCSAPAGVDAREALASLGRMNLRLDSDPAGRAPLVAQVAIQHPNHTGLAMDQSTRQYTPADYVRKLELSYGGQPVFAADVDFSMSENPNFRIRLAPRAEGGALRAVVVDSREREFAAELPPRR